MRQFADCLAEELGGDGAAGTEPGLGAGRGRDDDRDRLRGDARGAAPARARGRCRARRGGGEGRGGGERAAGHRPRAALGRRARPRAPPRAARSSSAPCPPRSRWAPPPRSPSGWAGADEPGGLRRRAVRHPRQPARARRGRGRARGCPSRRGRDRRRLGGRSDAGRGARAAARAPVARALAPGQRRPLHRHGLRRDDPGGAAGAARCSPPTPGPRSSSAAPTATSSTGCRRCSALDVDGLGEVLFCHATARSDEERVTVFTPEERLARILAEAGAPLLVGGHTHRQFDRSAGGRRMVNAGSVGRPYEDEPGAYWLRLGPGVELRRTSYDTAAATRAVPRAGLPVRRRHARPRRRRRGGRASTRPRARSRCRRSR